MVSAYNEQSERWTTVYSSEGLDGHITDLANSFRPKPDLVGQRAFYNLVINDPEPCQGDVVRLECDIPLIDETGQPAVEEGTGLWLYIGNSCDSARPIDKVPFAQMVPLVRLPEVMSEGELQDLRSYKGTKSFYLPAWPSSADNRGYSADFLRPVPVHRLALKNAAKIEARMTRHSWSLLHCCLVRFLARDDGREVPD